MENKVTESIFNGATNIIPMADVQNIEKVFNKPNSTHVAYNVITCHTKYDFDRDHWANAIYLSKEEGDEFLKAWCVYRAESEVSNG